MKFTYSKVCCFLASTLCLIRTFKWAAFSLLLGLAFAPLRTSAIRELRGVWIATVSNIDWPSQQGLPVEKQQEELIQILDRCKLLKLNAVFLHVRPNSDALYHSELEPWSRFLTGTQGAVPTPFWDPLEFAVFEAHKRGIELHAWVNPFSGGTIKNAQTSHPTHIVNALPHAIREYGVYKWCDPSEEEVQIHIQRVIADLVTRYNLDGITIDDFFYPYPKENLDFPDDKNWKAYLELEGALSRSDWRRSHINRFVKNTCETIKSIKPWVKFGISPFGIYKPGVPEGIVGLNQFEAIYSDPLCWIQNGWCDFLSPQLYWPECNEKQQFSKLLSWWSAQSAQDVTIVPSLATYLVKTSEKTSVAEISNQIQRIRQELGATGHIHFSMKVFKEDPKNLCKTLTENHYICPALPPLTKGWKAAEVSASTSLTSSKEGQDLFLTWSYDSDQVKSIKFFAIYKQVDNLWSLVDIIGSEFRTYRIPLSEGMVKEWAISAINLYNHESPLVITRQL